MGPIRIALVIAAVLAAAAAAYLFWPWRDAAVPVVPPSAPAPAAPPARTGPQHPLPAEPATPLPALAASDAAMGDALVSLFGPEAMRRLFRVDSLVRNLVATIDNLPREAVAARLNPIQPVGGLLATTGKDASRAIAPANAARYAAYVRAMESVDTAKAAAVYKRFYPLFQQAYEELGYPGRYFNDRAVEVIDHLLQTPELREPPRLVQPKVLYEFADPALEERSAGQKVLLRIGTANAARVKAKLRELRAAIAAP